MNSPIGKNMRRCALKYGIGEGDIECWRFSKEFVVQGFIYDLTREVLRGRILRAILGVLSGKGLFNLLRVSQTSAGSAWHCFIGRLFSKGIMILNLTWQA